MLSSFLLFKMLNLPLEFSRGFHFVVNLLFCLYYWGLSKTGSYHIAQNGPHEPHESPASTFQTLKLRVYAMTHSPVH